MHKIGDDRRILGILGGLGPLASAYFYELLIEHTKAKRDQDNIDIIMSGRATTPDRTDFILGDSDDSPLPYMIEDAKLLEQYGADAIVIPCNTAHYFIDQVRDSVSVPVPSIIDETAEFVKGSGAKKVAILATEGTISAGSYQDALTARGVEYQVPDEKEQSTITSVIYDSVKCGKLEDASRLLDVANSLFEEGCDLAILACTELSVLKRELSRDDRFLDSLEVLAHRAITMFGRKTQGFSEKFESVMGI